MSSRPTRSLTSSIGAIFVERRLYIRTEESTRYLVIRPGTQVLAALSLLALVGWTGFATSAFVTNAMDGRSARIKLDTVAEAYEARLAASNNLQRDLEEQLNEANLRRDAVTARLSDKQARLVEAANSMQEAGAELRVLRERFASVLDQRREDAARIDALETELAALQVSLARTELSKANLDGALETLSGAMAKVIAERDRKSSDAERLGGELAQLNATIGQFEDREERLLSRLEEAARTSMEGLETLFGRPVIDLDAIMAQARRDYGGSGGPFIPISRDGEENVAPSDAVWEGDTRVAALMGELENINLMRFAAERLPFGDPIPGGRRTSGFGPRQDPKGRGYGMHDGLDIAAPRGTAIYATADGVVTFAGRQRGYGQVVKIRHAFGFETVYAHNSRIHVKVGQRVSRGDRVASVGSTGRSTGNHVHYEIRIDDAPVNPVKFIEAARNVL